TRLAVMKKWRLRMPTANEAYRDAVLRHQIGLRRYAAGLTKRIAELLERADRDLAEKLRARLARFEREGRELDFTGERWKALLADVRAARDAALQQYAELVRASSGSCLSRRPRRNWPCWRRRCPLTSTSPPSPRIDSGPSCPRGPSRGVCSTNGSRSSRRRTGP